MLVQRCGSPECNFFLLCVSYHYNIWKFFIRYGSYPAQPSQQGYGQGTQVDSRFRLSFFLSSVKEAINLHVVCACFLLFSSHMVNSKAIVHIANRLTRPTLRPVVLRAVIASSHMGHPMDSSHQPAVCYF